MATHDYVIANASGAAVRADLNNALAAIVTNNSNATEPATTYPYMLWADTTTGQLKLRNAANDEWNVLQSVVNSGVAPPSTPEDNQLWFNTDDGRLYIYYNDGSSSQWIDASPDNLPPLASETDAGIAEIATTAEVTTGTDDGRIVTPLKLREAEVWSRSGTTVSLKTSGDDVDLGTGDLSATYGNFTDSVDCGPGTAFNGGNTATTISVGAFLASNTVGTQAVFLGYTTGNSTPTTVIFANGDVTADLQKATATASNVNISLAGELKRVTSSLRWKTDVEDIDTTYLDNLITNSRPVWYRSTAGDDRRNWSHYGFIAEEMAQVDPRLVFYDDTDPDNLVPIGIQYDRFVAPLMAAVQSQQARIEALEAEVQSLKGGN